MVEPLMFFALGFLVASLLALTLLPSVHGRALRLAAKRMNADTPLSLKEIGADRDLLRAEFAVAARRFEMTIEKLNARLARLRADLGRKTNEIGRLKVELAEARALAAAPQLDAPGLQPQLSADRAERRIDAAPRGGDHALHAA
jgi:hypothetical protein